MQHFAQRLTFLRVTGGSHHAYLARCLAGALSLTRSDCDGRRAGSDILSHAMTIRGMSVKRLFRGRHLGDLLDGSIGKCSADVRIYIDSVVQCAQGKALTFQLR